VNAPPSEAAPFTPSQIKDQMELKRRNDAVRIREFDQLRKVIRLGREVPTLQVVYGASEAAPLRDGGPSIQDRGSILDKIDGAEAHLEQWWGSGSKRAPLSRPGSLKKTAPSKPAPLPADDDIDLDFTDLSALETLQKAASSTPAASSPAAPSPAAPPPGMVSKPLPAAAKPVRVPAMYAVLNKAATFFAEGDFDATQEALLTLLERPDLASESAERLNTALFEVYRCAGQRERYEALALDYAHRFGRSPPEWTQLDDGAPRQALSLQHAQAGASEAPFIWTCPALLDRAALDDCRARHAADGASRIAWEALEHLDPSVAMALPQLVHHWCDSPLHLHWSGTPMLLTAVQAQRQSGDAREGHAWWLLELDVLRILRQEQAFEDLALEYCVAFEVSPPSWSLARCQLQETEKSTDAVPLPSYTAPHVPAESTTAAASSAFELVGNLIGDHPAALQLLRQAGMGHHQISVSCARLGRVDSLAAAALLDWVKECNARGCKVQFTRLPRLVFVYLHLLGAEKLAGLSTAAR